MGSYLWGDYQGLHINPKPNVRILNLETAITSSIHNPDVPRKGINYHMSSDNLEPVLQVYLREQHDGQIATPDRSTQARNRENIPVILSLANNHILGRTNLV